MSQNGGCLPRLPQASAAEIWRAGLIDQEHLGAVSNVDSARFSLAHTDLLISSSTGFQRSARSDTSTRFESGKQAEPDTIEHFLGSGPEGQAAMANWLKGGFELRSGEHTSELHSLMSISSAVFSLNKKIVYMMLQ